jgi:glyoxylase-like metal-dependent hydrolase (beta-lactamase superfamily II)
VDPELVRTFALRDGVWQLRLPLPWEDVDHVNAYILECEDGIVLVDCGSAGHETLGEALQRGIAGTGHRVEEVRALVCTHAHSDHVGQAEWVVAASGCDLLMHRGHAHLYDAIHDSGGIVASRLRGARREGVPTDRLTDFADVAEEIEGVLGAPPPTSTLDPGDRLVAAGAAWEVLETPGHTPSDVSLLAPDLGLAIVGDLVAPAFVPWFEYGFSHDPVGEYLESLAALQGAGEFDLYLPGHGRPIANLPPVLAAHREGVEDGLRRTLDAVAVGPASGYEVAERVFGPFAGTGDFRLVDQVVAYLRHLWLEGLVVREDDDRGGRIHAIRR